jgi:protoporphyrinogen oxidase
MPAPDFRGRIIIIGAGPTGLGAAYRLRSLGYENWALYEKEDHIGGLSASFKDSKGFTWDIGGHVMFSNKKEFNELADRLLGKDFLSHDRESWVRMMGRWVPYPFQNNIRHLPRESVLRCLLGLIAAQRQERPVANFEEWIFKTFGEGIAEHFMLPYNFKVWAYPPSCMGYGWIAERVSVIDIERILKNVLMDLDDTGWGPNNRFKFPLFGGTGGFFNAFEPFVRRNLHYQRIPVNIHMDERIITFNDGSTERYDALINTSPLDLFVQLLTSQREDVTHLWESAANLVHNSGYVLGIGLKKKMKGTRCWVYFPENDIPFYRMTYFSHYSPNNVPQGDTATYSSLMCEVSFSPHKPVAEQTVLEDTISGLISTGIIEGSDRDRIVSTWQHKIDYSYPVPTTGRDDALRAIQPVLDRNGIFSRGRFGAWRYEIGNMDHSVLMGIEAVNRILFDTREQLWNQ